MMKTSDLSEGDLRRLFSILERDHPDALSSSLSSLLNGLSGEEIDETESPQVVKTTEEDAINIVELVSSENDQDSVISTTNTNYEEVHDASKKIQDVVQNDVVPNTTAEEADDASENSQDVLDPPVVDEVDSSINDPPVSPSPTSTKPIPPMPSIEAGEGCYLHYEASSAKLKLQYSKSPVSNAIGFYSASTIPAFKYKRNFGRAELIGNCASGVAGRKNYYSGLCQFIRLARSFLKAEIELFGEIKGEMYLYPIQEGHQGLDVDIYVFSNSSTVQTMILPQKVPIQNIICIADAVACLPMHCDIFVDVKQMDMNRWLTEANNVGATSRMTDKPSISKSTPPKAASLYSTKKFIPVTTTVVEPTRVLDNNEPSKEDAYTYTKPVIQEDKEEAKKDKFVPPEDQDKVEGCYLLYDSDSCKLMLQYSKTQVKNAIGFYCAGPGHSIKAFKFKRNFGRAELIGNCASGVAGRKNFYSGWCQFIRAARAIDGQLWLYPREKVQQGLDVDIYVYYNDPQELGLGEYQTIKLNENEKLNVTDIDAVVCLPKFSDFFDELKLVEINRWLTEGNTIGATSRFT